MKNEILISIILCCCFAGMQYPYSSGSSPNILESSSSDNIEEVSDTDHHGGKKVQSHPGPPRAMSRSAMVKACSAGDNKNEISNEKPTKNVSLVDTPQIFPSGTSMTTRAVIESSASSSGECQAPNHPRGINRLNCEYRTIFFRFITNIIIFPPYLFWKMRNHFRVNLALQITNVFSFCTCLDVFFSVVNELILKEKSERPKSVLIVSEEGGMSSSSGSSTMAESSAKSSSARSSMQSTTSNTSSTTIKATSGNRLEDSSNDSGHNSMNTSEKIKKKFKVKYCMLQWLRCPQSVILCRMFTFRLIYTLTSWEPPL
jgi:hypothetical protein